MDLQHNAELAFICLRGNYPEISSIERIRIRNYKEKLIEKLLTLTKSNQDFVFKNLHPKTNVGYYSFSLNDENDRRAANAAVAVDSTISKYKPLLVPKLMTEEIFFENYFSHVMQLRRQLLRYNWFNEEKESDEHHMVQHFEGKDDSFIYEKPLSPVRIILLKSNNSSNNKDDDVVLMSPFEIIGKLLDFSSPRALDVILRKLGKDRQDFPRLIKASQWVNVLDKIQSIISNDFSNNHRMEAGNTPASLEKEKKTFTFRIDRDEECVLMLHRLNRIGLIKLLERQVPNEETETEFFLKLLTNIAEAIYISFFD